MVLPINHRDTRKVVHVVSTGWFVLSVGYLLVLGLLQASKSWWVILSVSGYSALLVFLLISLYLFAIFRGVARSQKTKVEHPLTTSAYYSFFYDVSPFLGALAGSIAALGVSKLTHYLLVIAVGTLWVTFVVWIIVDPTAGLLEMLLPSSREHRRKRLAQAKAARQKQRLVKEHLLAEAQAREKLERSRWIKSLLPYAEKLAALVAEEQPAYELRETEAVDIGVTAWQLGGLNCMRQLHSMTIEICKRKYANARIIDYISIWWDGVGSWRSRWLEAESEPISEGEEILCGV